MSDYNNQNSIHATDGLFFSVRGGDVYSFKTDSGGPMGKKVHENTMSISQFRTIAEFVSERAEGEESFFVSRPLDLIDPAEIPSDSQVYPVHVPDFSGDEIDDEESDDPTASGDFDTITIGESDTGGTSDAATDMDTVADSGGGVAVGDGGGVAQEPDSPANGSDPVDDDKPTPPSRMTKAELEEAHKALPKNHQASFSVWESMTVPEKRSYIRAEQNAARYDEED